MSSLLALAAHRLGMDPLTRLRLRLWLGRRVHGAIAGTRGLSRRAPAAPPGGFLVLLYHRISAEDPGWGPTRGLSVPVDLFRAQMEEVCERFQPASIDELLDRDAAGGRPRVAVTFDDGYRDNMELAHPVLAELGIPAAVFVTTGWLGGRARAWWCELEELVRRGALGEAREGERFAAYAEEVTRLKRLSEEARRARLDELRARAAGPVDGGEAWAPPVLGAEDLRFLERSGLWTIGAHTHRHPILSRLPLAEAEAEIVECRRALEEALGHPPRWFAYPNGDEGDFGEEHVALLRRHGFRGAFTGISPFRGGHQGDTDPFRIPRLAVSGLEGLAEFRNHLAGVFWPR